MIQDKIFFDEKDPTGLSYNTPFTFYGSYQGRLWSKAPGGEIKYYTQNSDLSVYAITGSNQFNGNQAITGSLTVTGGIIGITATSSYVEYSNVANKPTLVSGSSQVAQFGYAITGSNQFKASQAITGSLVVTEQIVAQTLNVQQVTSSIVYSSGSNIFGNNSGNTHRFTGSVNITGSLSVNGAGTFTSTVTATNGTFINGSNQNTLGSGTLELLTYAGYNSSANQSITLGLAIDEAVNNSKAYQYNLGATGNATGQNLVLTSKRRGTTDLTILTIDGTGGGATFTGALNGTTASFKVNADRNLAIKYDTNITISGQADSGGPESLRIYADTFRIYTATTAVGLTERFTISNSGNIGIGAPSPGNLLALEKSSNSGSGSTFPRIKVMNTLATQGDGTSTFNFADIMISTGNEAVNMFLATTYAAGTWAPAGIINVSTNHELQFKTNNTTRLTLANSGAATFSSSVTATGGTEIPNGQFYRARRTSSNLLIDLLGIESGTDNTRLLITGDLNIKNGSLDTLLNITTTGVATFSNSVGIGIAPNNGKLHIVTPAGADFQNAINLEKAGGYGNVFLQSYYVDVPNYGLGIRVGDTTRMVVNGAGNVGINTNSPSYKLSVNGNFYTSGAQHNDSGYYYSPGGGVSLKKLVNIGDNTTTTVLTFSQNGSYSYIGGGEILIVFGDQGSPWGVYVWKGLITIRTVTFGSLYSTGLTEISSRNNLDGSIAVSLQSSKDGGVPNAVIRVVITTGSGIGGAAYVSFDGWVGGFGGSQPV